MALDLPRIRAQFPALSITDDGRPRLYFDNPAGTQVPQRVIDRMLDALVRYNANLGGEFCTTREATEVVHRAHEAMADMYHAPSADEIVFGLNMTSLTFAMTRSIGAHLQAQGVRPGDDIVLTQMEHDGNASTWTTMARELGLGVKRVPFDPATGELHLDHLDGIITERTRFVGINYASNILGTVNDVAQLCARAREVGAITYVDAVQYAPHGPIDVQALGCDFLVSSSYKFYGPHQGILWGRRDLLASLPVWKLRVVPDVIPKRFETGTPSVEGQAGVLGAVEYLQWVGTEMGAEYLDESPAHLRARTREVHAGLRAMVAYEHTLSERLIGGLQRLPGVTVHGITDPARFAHRLPTVSITVEGIGTDDMARHLAAHNVFVWDGHSYAIDVIEHLGLADRGGVVRLGPTHYTTLDEVDTVVGLIAERIAHGPA